MTWEDLSQEADRALARADYERAALLLERALEAAAPFAARDRRRFSTLYRLAWAEANSGRHRRATRHARRAIDEAESLEDAVQARLAFLTLVSARYAMRLAHGAAEILWAVAAGPLRRLAPRLHARIGALVGELERAVARQAGERSEPRS